MAASLLPTVVTHFLEAVDDRDAQRIAHLVTDNIVYYLAVPRPPIVGRAAVTATLARVLKETKRVQSEVRSWAMRDDLVFLERVDRFWYGDNNEASIECLGVFAIRDGLIAEIRDYADMETWKARKAAAIATP